VLESDRNLLLVFTKSSSTSVYKSGAVQNGLLCEVDITALEPATCCPNNGTVI